MSGGSKLYFDGQCPLCSGEMRRLEARKGEGLELIDIHSLELDKSKKERMLRQLHLENEDGSVTIGLEANIKAWEFTKWGWAWKGLRLPVIGSAARVVYEAWAEQRYEKRYGGKRS